MEGFEQVLEFIPPQGGVDAFGEDERVEDIADYGCFGDEMLAALGEIEDCLKVDDLSPGRAYGRILPGEQLQILQLPVGLGPVHGHARLLPRRLASARRTAGKTRFFCDAIHYTIRPGGGTGLFSAICRD